MQDYIVDPLSVKKCETSSGSDDVDFDLELESKDGAKYLQMKVKLNRTVNDQCTVRQLEVFSGQLKNQTALS